MRTPAIGRAVAAAATVLIAGLATPAYADAPQPLDPDACQRTVGNPSPTSTWALNQLQVNRVNSITRGRNVRTGDPVRVAVIDSGLDTANPLFDGINADSVRDAMANDDGEQYDDCIGHGTQVTAIIAAQPNTRYPQFVGVAPEAKIIPIKVTNTGEDIAAADIAHAIDLAVAQRARIVNLSLTLPVDVPVVRAAVARAARAKVLLVAAAGNDNEQANKATPYPAAYATKYDNVIGVSATTAANAIAKFSRAGAFVGVAAPGDGVQTVGVANGYSVQAGTSFAAPYVTGAAALTLAANPGLDAAGLRNRLEATAETPPATIPSMEWGYGTVDPYLAVTSRRDDVAPATPSAGRGTPIPAARPVVVPDRTLQHVAIALALGMLGLGVIVVVAAVILRSPRRGATAARR